MEDIINDYRVYIELREILKYTDKSINDKIPKRVFSLLNSVNSNGYEFSYDFSKNLDEQKVSPKTFELLSGLYIKYCCDEEKAQKLIKICKQNDEDINKKFEFNWHEHKADKRTETVKNEQVTNLTVIKENIFTRIINKIKNIFKR